MKIILVKNCGECPYYDDSYIINCTKYGLLISDETIIHPSCQLPDLPQLKMKTEGASIKFITEEE